MIREACPTLAPQRREHIRLLVRESGVARVEDLRQGIKSFCCHNKPGLRGVGGGGKVRRVHGGAVSTESRLDEAVFDDKTNQFSKQKRAIAEEAYQLIGQEESLFLDGEVQPCAWPDY